MHKTCKYLILKNAQCTRNQGSTYLGEKIKTDLCDFSQQQEGKNKKGLLDNIFFVGNSEKISNNLH